MAETEEEFQRREGVSVTSTILVDRIHQIALLAEDLETSVEFYRDRLGLQFIAKFDPPGLAFFDVGGVRLMLEKNAPKGTVYLRVKDIHAAYKELTAKGVEFIDEPHLIHRDAEGLFGPAGEEEWMAFFYDPSGNLLALASRRS
jgi:catechol 2,3-dioxygenase-like lactoylglutathione lyase family enzyme